MKDVRKGAVKHVGNKLADDERDAIVKISCCEEYQSLTPCEIVPLLAEKNIYLGSERTFYRVLGALGLIHHRSLARPASRKSRPKELVATAPHQVWSWDITYLRSLVAGIYFYAYIVLDVFSRKIVGWEISDRESETVSSAMFCRLAREMDLKNLSLHSDRGNPMKGATMLMTLYRLGVVPSFSRPRVSDDNPYSEALFRTVKYHRTYPGAFETPEKAREWFAGFIHWYNTEHLHSGIGYVTPEARHAGMAEEIYDKRNETYAKAFALHPERWSRKPKIWKGPQVVILNPAERNIQIERKIKAA